MQFFVAIELYHYFSGNPANVTEMWIFEMSKTREKVVKITSFDLLRGPFIHRDQASRWVPKIMQNDAKMHLKSPQNEHEKTWPRCCNGQKRTPSLDLRKCIKLRSFLSFPVLLCSRHGCKNCSKSSKIHYKMTTKNTKPGVALVKNTCRRPTCENV